MRDKWSRPGMVQGRDNLHANRKVQWSCRISILISPSQDQLGPIVGTTTRGTATPVGTAPGRKPGLTNVLVMSCTLCKDLVVDPPRRRIALTADDTAERRADGSRGCGPVKISTLSRDRDHVGVWDRGARQADHRIQAGTSETGAGVGGAREVVGDDCELRHGALARRRCGTGIAGVRHLKRDVDGGQQARLLRDSLPGDIEGRAVVDRGADDRQAIADIDP